MLSCYSHSDTQRSWWFSDKLGQILALAFQFTFHWGKFHYILMPSGNKITLHLILIFKLTSKPFVTLHTPTSLAISQWLLCCIQTHQACCGHRAAELAVPFLEMLPRDLHWLVPSPLSGLFTNAAFRWAFPCPLSARFRLSLFTFLVVLAAVSSVTQSYLTLCDPMDCSMPGFPLHHQLLELTQTHIHWVGDAIQPSHPLSPPSPLAFNHSQHQGLF